MNSNIYPPPQQGHAPPGPARVAQGPTATALAHCDTGVPTCRPCGQPQAPRRRSHYNITGSLTFNNTQNKYTNRALTRAQSCKCELSWI